MAGICLGRRIRRWRQIARPIAAAREWSPGAQAQSPLHRGPTAKESPASILDLTSSVPARLLSEFLPGRSIRKSFGIPRIAAGGRRQCVRASDRALRWPLRAGMANSAAGFHRHREAAAIFEAVVVSPDIPISSRDRGSGLRYRTPPCNLQVGCLVLVPRQWRVVAQRHL